MGLWEQFPFTNFHQENLDWVLQNQKQLAQDVNDIKSAYNPSQVATKTDVKQQIDAVNDDLSTETQNRLTADEMLDNRLTANISATAENTKRSIEASTAIGSWTQGVTMSQAISAVQSTSGKNASAIAGTGGTYDATKGTIQNRLNSLEKLKVGTPVSIVQHFFISAMEIAPTNGFYSWGRPTDEFDFAVVNFTSASPAPSNFRGDDYHYIVYYGSDTYQGPFNRIFIDFYSDSDNSYYVNLDIVLLKKTESFDPGDTYATIGYVDDKIDSVNSQLSTINANVTTAQDTADIAKAAANSANTNATTAINQAASANTTASSANNTANSAKTSAENALSAIGEKSAQVKFNNLWSTVGAWNDSATLSTRLNEAYTQTFNNMSAINGSSQYPTSADTINNRLTYLEEASSKSSVKHAWGSTTAVVTSGQETIINYENAGFLNTPAVVASYSTTGDNPSVSGFVKVFDKTTTTAKLTVSSGQVGTQYAIDWIAIGT